MARIFYSMAGEGRGHAARVRTITELLRGRHQLTLLAPGDAFEMLEPAYRGSDVRVQRIAGLRFAYDARQRVAPLGTGRLVLDYLGGLRRQTAELAAQMRAEGADLLVTDYDPGGPRAADRAGIPYVALDHQSCFTYGDFTWLPGPLRRRAALVRVVNHALYHGQRHTISSSFFRPEPRRGARDVTFVGALMRAPVLAAARVTGDHVVAYCRRTVSDNVLAALAECPRPVRLFGLGTGAPRGSITFEPFGEESFVAALASACAVVASAGNQLLGEALFLGKPFLALPETGQHEQAVNVAWLERLGAGRGIAPLALTALDVRTFLDGAERHRDRVDPALVAGNADAVAALEQQIERFACR
jgi:uncharacterized protein (TIGR00661 family)